MTVVNSSKMPRGQQGRAEQNAIKTAKTASNVFDHESIQRIINSLKNMGNTPYDIDNVLVEMFKDKKCPICYDRLTAPVTLNEECTGCSSVKFLTCLPCLRSMLQLNTDKTCRLPVKHLICSKEYDTRNMCGKSYTVNLGLMEFFDRKGINPEPCPKCNEQFITYVETYAHLSPSWRVYLGCPDVKICPFLGQ